MTIDTSFIDQKATPEPADPVLTADAVSLPYASHREARLAPAQAAPEPNADHPVENIESAAEADGEVMTVEEMVAELTELRDLTTLFDKELTKAQADNEVLRADAAAKAQQIAELNRSLAAAEESSNLAEEPAPATAALAALEQQIDALRGELSREREARSKAVAQADEATRTAQAAMSDAAKLRLTAAPVPVAGGTGKDVAAMKEAMALLRANHEAELLAEQAARRAVEAQKELADRRLAAAQRQSQFIEETASEMSRLQAERDELAGSVNGLKAELSNSNEKLAAVDAKLTAAENIARERDEMAARCDTLEADLKGAKARLAAQERDAQTMIAAQRQLEASLQQAVSAKAELEATLAARDESQEKALAAVRGELQTALAARERELEIERNARVTAEAGVAELNEQLAAIEEQMARLKISEQGFAAAAKTEADAQRELAAHLDQDLKVEAGLRAKADALAAGLKARVAELESELKQACAAAAAPGNDESASADLRRSIASLEACLAQEKHERAEAERRLADAQADLAETERKLQAAVSTPAAGRPDEAAFADMRQSIAALEARLSQERHDRNELENRLAAAEARAAELSLDTAKSSSANRELLNSTRREVDTLRSLVAQLEGDLKAEQEAAEAVRLELENAQKILEELPDEDEGEYAAGTDLNAERQVASPIGRSSNFDRDAAFATGPIPLVAQQPAGGFRSADPAADLPNGSDSTESGSPPSSVDRGDATSAPTSAGPEGRRERRTQSQAPATVWQNGMSHAMQCTIRNRSSGGALLEFPRDRHGMGVTEFSVGDELTLTFTSYRERSSVRCIVTRIENRMCGVKFAGQFHVELLKSTKPKKPMPGKDQQPAAAVPAKGGLKLPMKLGSKLGRT